MFTYEQLVAFGIASVSVVIVLVKMGLITFGRPVERRKACTKCPEHVAVMEKIKDDREDIRKDVAEIKQSIEKLKVEIGRRIDELARLIHDHIGYCRGIQEQRRRDG